MKEEVYMKKNVLIFFGGESVEHDISIITALQVMQNLSPRYNFIPVYIGRNGVWQTAENMQDVSIYSNFKKKAKKIKFLTIVSGKPYVAIKKHKSYSKFIPVDFALLCNHGRFGEDGTLQGVLESSHIPYSSCDVKSSAVTMDKVFMKDVFVARNIPSLPYIPIEMDDFKENKENIIKLVGNKLNFPVILKPANLGSSIGIKVCYDKKDFLTGMSYCAKFDRRILVEKFLDNIIEINCACVYMNNSLKVSDIQVVKKEDEIYSFKDKYLSNNDKNMLKIDKKTSILVKKLTQKLYKVFNCFGVVRVDFIYDKDSKHLFVNEINSIPGSLAFYLFKDLSFKDLVTCLIEEGMERFCREQYVTAYDSEALEIFESLKITQKQK